MTWNSLRKNSPKNLFNQPKVRKMTKKFWIIFNESGSKTRVSKPTHKLVRHEHKHVAVTEQNRLATTNPGEIFVLMEAISTVVVNNTNETILK